jgi:hypothetical protein
MAIIPLTGRQLPPGSIDTFIFGADQLYHRP